MELNCCGGGGVICKKKAICDCAVVSGPVFLVHWKSVAILITSCFVYKHAAKYFVRLQLEMQKASLRPAIVE